MCTYKSSSYIPEDLIADNDRRLEVRGRTIGRDCVTWWLSGFVSFWRKPKLSLRRCAMLSFDSSNNTKIITILKYATIMKIRIYMRHDIIYYSGLYGHGIGGFKYLEFIGSAITYWWVFLYRHLIIFPLFENQVFRISLLAPTPTNPMLVVGSVYFISPS